MPSPRLLAALVLTLLPAFIHAASLDSPAPAPAQDPAEIVRNLHFRQGEITLRDNLATLNVPAGFRYLDAPDARKVLVDLWGNPPESATNVIGMITHSGSDHSADHTQSYGVVITYDGSGYVKDDEADTINYDTMLKQMQQATLEHNPVRTKEGYPAMELVGWAAPPHYDRAAKKLYWAKEFAVSGQDTHALNYDIRILGRRGVLVLSAVAAIDQLDEINQATPQILSMVNFQQGNRYADFNPKTDKVAAYGLAALVAGGVLAKAGGLKLLLGLLIAAKKFVVIGLVAISGFFKRLFGGRKRVNDGPQALPPSLPPPGGGVS